MRAWIAAAFALVLASSTVACGAILGFPDQTNADPNFGSGEGGGPDGSTPLDGSAPDGFVPDGPGPSDSSLPLDAPIVSPDGGCNCFGGTCNGGVCQPVAIATGQLDPNFIDTDGTTVFFGNGVHSILAVVDPNNVDAGVRSITNLSEPNLNDLRASGGYVYFTNLLGNSSNGVSRCSGSTGCAGERAEYSVSSRKAFGVAVDGTNVYYTDSELQGSNGGIWSSPKNDAGATRILPRDFPGLIVTNGTSLSWLETNSGNGLQQASKLGTGFNQTSQSAIVDLTYGTALDVYYVKGSELWRRVGTQIPTQIGGTPQVSNALAVRADASYVYWINGGVSNGALMRCPAGVDCLLPINAPVAIATALNNPYGLALGTDSIYFTTRADGKVWRLRK